MSAPFSACGPVFPFPRRDVLTAVTRGLGIFDLRKPAACSFCFLSNLYRFLTHSTAYQLTRISKSKIYAAKHLSEAAFSVSANKKCHHQFHCKRAMADTQRNNTAILTTQKPQQISLIRMPAAPASPIRHSFYFLILSCEMTDSGFRQAAGLLLSSIAAHSLITVRDVHHLTSLYMHDQ